MKTIRQIFPVNIFFVFFLISCWSFLSIDQPDLADPNSSFDVPITISLTAEDKGGRGYFGILLPIGWTAEESISYTGVHNGTFIYSGAASDSMEAFDNAPDGYYWWVSVGDTIESLLEGTVSFTPRIYTDNQSGTFFIDYIVADRFEFSNDICSPRKEYVVHSGFYPISVNAPMTAAVTNTNDDGPGSLRQAIAAVSCNGEIIFDLSYPANIQLDNQMTIDRSVTIMGPETGLLTILGTDSTGVFYIKEHLNNVNINNLKISQGNDRYGGGIYCLGSTLTLNKVILDSNSAEYSGGGIFFAPFVASGGG